MSGSILKLGVLGSGRGSNYAAIQRAIDRGDCPAEVRVVISDVEDAPILEFARTANIPALFIPPGKYRTRMESEAEQTVVETLHRYGVDLVVLAGFMRMIKQPLLDAFPRRIINIHPSLLPAFPGLESWKQALATGAQRTGCTVHWVDAGMDTGDIIAQAEVPVFQDDTAETLHARIQMEEHRLYPEVIKQLVEIGLR